MNLPQLPNRPILLTTTVPVPVGAVREPQDKYALQPAFNEALLLDEIRFDYLRPATNGPPAPLTSQGVNPWNDIRVEFTMGGSLSFTYQPVPLSALNTSPNPYLWNFSYNSVVFRLPKPLYLNPGDMFVPRFHNNWINDATIQVTYAARRTPVRPAENWYPYVTSYTSPQFNILPDTDSFLLESAPSDLVNPYDVPLLVDRLVGFIGTNSIFGGFGGGPILRNPADYAGDYLNVRLFDSAERPIVRDLTPFNMLFNLQGRAWQMKSILHPHEYYIAQISYENNAAQYYDPPTRLFRQPSSMTANIVLIGSRRADAAYTKRRLNNLDIPTKFGPANVRPDWNLPKLKKG